MSIIEKLIFSYQNNCMLYFADNIGEITMSQLKYCKNVLSYTSRKSNITSIYNAGTGFRAIFQLQNRRSIVGYHKDYKIDNHVTCH